MIYLRTTDLLLSAPVTHTSTDWQVATDLQFTNIISQSIGDRVNLSSILFDVRLDSSIKYYARSRVLLSTGYTAWSNIDIFTPTNITDSGVNAPIPSLVTLPTISITGGPDAVSLLNAVITVGGVSTTAGAAHTSTTYLIEDMNGLCVWNSDRDAAGKLSKNIPVGVLSANTLYRLRVLVHVESQDTSQLCTYTFRTVDRTHGLVIPSLASVPPTANLVVDVNIQYGITHANGLLYSITNGKATLVGTYNGAGANSNIITIPAASLKPLQTYLLHIDTSNASIWDQRTFTTTA